MSSAHPILYSYRRCPYAMRARMGIYLAGLEVEQREIVFWDKPEHMLQLSPKGTVPVLLTDCGEVIDESWDILLWALERAGLTEVYYPENKVKEINNWVVTNDDEFKYWLDRYKYADRYPEKPPEFYRQQGEVFLQKIETALSKTSFLMMSSVSVADIALFPFIRQFVNVDKNWWQEACYPLTKVWLEFMLQQDFFTEVMKNRPTWEPAHQPLWVIESHLQTKDQFRHKALAEIKLVD